MNELTRIDGQQLTALLDRAAATLAAAQDSAGVLEALDLARVLHDAAKSTGRLAKAKGAYEELVTVAWQAQAHALGIEARAKARLAAQYQAAQARGELRKAGNPNSSKREKLPGVAQLGLTHKDLHQGRRFSAAEDRDPGIIERELNRMVEERTEPTRAKLTRFIKSVLSDAADGGTEPPKKTPSTARRARSFLSSLEKIAAVDDLEALARWSEDPVLAGNLRKRAIEARTALDRFISAAEADDETAPPSAPDEATTASPMAPNEPAAAPPTVPPQEDVEENGA